jgi:MFS family permease
MIGAPLANLLMTHFRTPSSVGVWETFVVLAAVYFVFMMSGAFAYRVPPDFALRASSGAPAPAQSMHYRDAPKTKQFWLIWAVLCLNVSAGIGVIGMASPMLQEIFGASAAVAAGFTGLISLFNIGGRFFWASLSDRIGRKATYATFFLLGIVLYAAAPTLARAGSQSAFVLAVCVIVSMYGGGFATIPAYLADTFGTQYVGAIHGRLLTAWSTAGIIGPVLVNYIREAQIAAGVPRQQVYDFTMYILAGLLLLGLVANALVKPPRGSQIPNPKSQTPNSKTQIPTPNIATDLGIRDLGFGTWDLVRATFAWAAVGIPIAWGAGVTFTQALVLFSGGA